MNNIEDTTSPAMGQSGYEEAERFVVGSLLAKPGEAECHEAMGVLSSPDGSEFLDLFLRKVFMAVRYLSSQGRDTSVGNAVGVLRDGQDFSMADIEAIARLQNYAYRSPHDVRAAAKSLRIRYLRNELGWKAEALAADCRDSGVNYATLQSQLNELIFVMSDNPAGGRPQKSDAFDTKSIETIEHRWACAEKGLPASGITSGFSGYDDVTGGFHRGELVVVGGRPSIGKTMMMAHSAIATAKSGIRTGCWTLEMAKSAIAERFVYNLTGLDARVARQGKFAKHCGGNEDAAMALREKYRARIKDGYRDLGGLPVWFYDVNSSIDNVLAAMLLAKRKHGIDLFLVDYIQRIGGSVDKSRAPRHEQVGDIAFKLKEFAKSENVAIVAYAQINRSAMGNQDAKPELENLKDSGGIEQEADVAVLLHRRKDKATGRHLDEMDIDIAKNRHGEMKTLTVEMIAHESRFVDRNEADGDCRPLALTSGGVAPSKGGRPRKAAIAAAANNGIVKKGDNYANY